MIEYEGGRRRVPRTFVWVLLWLAAAGLLSILLALVFLATVLL